MTNSFFLMASSLFLSLILITEGVDAQNSNNMTAQVSTVELTTFQLAQGVDESQFIEAASRMQSSFLDQQEGFIKRTLVKGETEWTDVVYWKDPESMQSAMKKAESSADAAPFMQMIDFESVKMNLSEIKLDTN